MFGNKLAAHLSQAGLTLALAGTGIEAAEASAQFPDLSALNLTLDKIAYILSIVASIYSLYLNRKKQPKKPANEAEKGESKQ